MNFLKKILPLIIGSAIVVVLIILAVTKQKAENKDIDKLSAAYSKTSEYMSSSIEKEKMAQKLSKEPPSQTMTTTMPTAYDIAPSAEPIIEDNGSEKVFKNRAQDYSFTVPEGYTLTETPRVIYLEKDADTKIAVIYGIGPYQTVDSAGENLSDATMLATISVKKDDGLYTYDYYAPENFKYPNAMDLQEYILLQHAEPDYVEGKSYEEVLQENLQKERADLEEAKKNNEISVAPSKTSDMPAETSALSDPSPTQTSITQTQGYADRLGNLRTEDFEFGFVNGFKTLTLKGQAQVLKTDKSTGVLVIPLSETTDQSEQVKTIINSFKMEDLEPDEITYKTFDGGKIKFEYPEGWGVSQQGELTVIKAPTGSASPYAGTVIAVHVDVENKVLAPQRYLDLFEDDLIASTFIEPVSKNDYDYNNTMEKFTESTIANTTSYYFEIIDTIRPYSEGVAAYIGPLGHNLHMKRHCFIANGTNCMINITTNNKGNKIWEHIVETTTIV